MQEVHIPQFWERLDPDNASMVDAGDLSDSFASGLQVSCIC